MADKNNKEFKWNFNLDDADSDFTDIDFTNTEYEKSDKDIQPIIFVRDESAKKKTAETKKPADEPETPAANKRSSAAARKPAAKKPAPKKKNESSLPALNWKLIAIIAAGVLLVACLVLLLSRCGKKEVKAWTAVEADDKVKTLMDRYFAAKKNGVADDVRKVLVGDAVVNASVVALESAIYSDYSNIKLQKYPGINKEECVVCATYDTELEYLKKVENVPRNVPTISWFYALPDETKELRLMTVTELDKTENKDIKNYVVAASDLLKDTTVAEVQNRYNEVVNSSEILKKYLQNIKEGNYYQIPTEAESTEPEASTEAVPDTTAEEVPVTPGTFAYVNASSLNMRTGASTDAEKVRVLGRGYCVNVISEEGDWLKIRDDVQTNPASGAAQDCSYKEGYISKTYTVNEFSKIKWD